MTPRQIDKATRGGPDVVRLPDPKPTGKAHWKKSIRAARLYADQWCREWVKQKYDRCVTCGNKINLEWAHILSGKGQSVRWEEKNMTRQCKRCNNLHEYEPEHLISWFFNIYGQPALNDLVTLANITRKYTFSQIMKIGDTYRAKVRGGSYDHH
jgi:hypothetical protein